MDLTLKASKVLRISPICYSWPSQSSVEGLSCCSKGERKLRKGCKLIQINEREEGRKRGVVSEALAGDVGVSSTWKA